jgi:ParB-like chromosome segregation protein Spo0J
VKILLSAIKPSSHQIRTSWDEQKLAELAESIRENGLLQPVKVRPANEQTGSYIAYLEKYGDSPEARADIATDIFDEMNDDGSFVGEEYELVYGHRRVEAARRAGLEEIEAMVETVDDTAALIQALIENVQREDMETMDKARALRDLKETTGWSNAKIEQRGIMHQDVVARLLSLLDEPEEVQRMIAPVRPGPKSRSDRDFLEGSDSVSYLHVTTVSGTGVKDEDKAPVLKKAAQEGLNREQTRIVAGAIAREPDPDVRAELIRRPFRGHENTWEDLARNKAEEDKELKQRQPSSLEWEMRPEVRVAFERIKTFEKDQLPEIEQMVELGKFSPEGVQFLVSRLRRLAATLLDMANRLEAKHGG